MTEKKHTFIKDDIDLSTPVVAVDLDGTIINFSWDTYQGVAHFDEVDHDMVKTLERMRHEGWHIIIHTCRMTPEVYEAQGYTAKGILIILRKFLVDAGIPFDDIWTGPGKPIARFYVDDRGITPEELKGHFRCQK